MIHYPVVVNPVQVKDSSVAFHNPLVVGHVTIYQHYYSNLVSTFQLLVRHTIVSVTGWDYSEAIRSISSRVEHVSNVAAHASIACINNLTPQTVLKYLGRTKQ